MTKKAKSVDPLQSRPRRKMPSTYYKFLNADGTTPRFGHVWHLPRGDKPGKWMPSIKESIAWIHHLSIMRSME